MTTYCFILKDLMIDTGQSHMEKQILGIAENHGIKRVVLTHHHEDHSGNAAAIKQNCGATVYGHELTKKKMRNAFHILPYQKYVWGETTPLNIKLLPEKIETFMGDMIPVHTPGHSKDHMAFFLKDVGILFSGDLYLADKIKFWEKGFSEKQIVKALKLKENYFTKYFGGHSDLSCGTAVTTKALASEIRKTAINFGGNLNALTCYLLERSLKTQSIRVKQQNKNAIK